MAARIGSRVGAGSLRSLGVALPDRLRREQAVEWSPAPVASQPCRRWLQASGLD
jgi:hypothetical protein